MALQSINVTEQSAGADPESGKMGGFGGTLLKKVEEQKKRKKGHNNNSQLSFTKYIISRMLCKIKSYL